MVARNIAAHAIAATAITVRGWNDVVGKIGAVLIALLQQILRSHTRAADLCRKKTQHVLRNKYVYLTCKRARPHSKQCHLAGGLRIHFLPHFALHVGTRILQIPTCAQKNKANCQHEQCQHGQRGLAVALGHTGKCQVLRCHICLSFIGQRQAKVAVAAAIALTLCCS